MSLRLRVVAPLGILSALAACGSADTGSSTSTATDVLAGRSPRDIVIGAQKAEREGHYRFESAAAATSTTTGIRGMPSSFIDAANAKFAYTSTGVVAGDKHVSVTARFEGHDPVNLVEMGCTGFASLDGGHSWSESPDARWLTRMVSPSLGDAMSSLDWRDLGPTALDGAAVHHLQATLTWVALRATAPSPGATPDPGVDVRPSPVDLWVRSDTGLTAKFTMTLDVSVDLGLSPQKNKNPDAAGIIRQHLTDSDVLTPASDAVSAPAASAGAPPIPPAILTTFGLFGIQKDSCDQPQAGSG
jgi:hypothetical protein